MRMVVIVLMLAVAVSFLAGSGCIAVSNPHTINKATTLGQELIDLKNAKESETVTEEEYQQLRKKLIDAAGRPWPCEHK